ncbi:hypothetical protein SD457_00760 [Coprobacillaceae bacterium CR2/5/TPMF4]|nr:hypothetical protein SD457_00760 [Coprobacillaceae bacterium CR2/5/TPMF4]
MFEDYPPRQVKITLYGTNNDVYEAVCGIKMALVVSMMEYIL